MEEELLEIANLMDNFSKKYDCKIEVETYEARLLENEEIKIAYKLKVIKPQKVLGVNI